jgi:hypothetical protein
VMVSGGVERADHGEAEKFLDGLDCRTRGEGAAGGVEEDFAEGAGEVMAGGEHGWIVNRERAAVRGAGRVF